MKRPPPLPPPADELTVIHNVATGDVLDDRWRLRDPLGQGAMGTVWAGEDLHTGDEVAVKILSAQHGRKAKVLARFEREAQLMTQLQHPNLVRFLGHGRRGALPYIVMEYLSGCTVSEHVKRNGGTLGGPDVLALMRQVCAGLSFLHHHGLVHRDIKPQNLFVGEGGRVTLLDFGVMRDRSVPALTMPGAMVGTPNYMSPEQAHGAEDVDFRSDLYALGAVVFELLTGQPPFLGKTSFEVLYAHRHTRPPLASELNPDVPLAVAQVLDRALAKKPLARHQDAQDFLEALERAFGPDLEGPTRIFTPPPVPDAAERGDTLPGEDPDEPSQTLPGSGELAMGELRVVTTVKGVTVRATLYVDDEEQGLTPSSLSLTEGVHRVRVEKKGYAPPEQPARVRAGQVELVRLELEPHRA